MAMLASDGGVGAGERETGLLVTSEGEKGRAKPFHVVTGLAAIQVRGGGKLSLVKVTVAVLAGGRGNFEESVFALREMALGAGSGFMSSLERVLRRGVLFDSKGRGLESFDGVTGGAFPGIGAGIELAAMRALVAVHAFGVRERRLEVAFGVAVAAGNAPVFAEKREIRFGVVEALETLDLFPT
jgi:hypothetical protein